MMMKNKLRIEFKKIIKGNEKAFASSLLSDFLIEKKYKNIGIYLDIKNEISIDNVIESLDANLYVPYMEDNGSKKIENASMIFRKYTKDLACLDDFNIRSSKGEIIETKELDLIIIPALGLNMDGYRIGYGKACYDKALSNFNKTIIAVAYDNCLTDIAFQEHHDKKVNFICTEKRLFQVRG